MSWSHVSSSRSLRAVATGAVTLVALTLLPTAGALAAPPVVKTVPWVAGNPLVPHDTWSGKSIRLKGTSECATPNLTYYWDFGDGSPATAPAAVNSGNCYALQALHTYTGATGTVFTARLHVGNTSTGESASREYFVEIRDRTLDVEANVAIDEGLWYLHRTQTRSGADGYWNSGNAGTSWYAGTANNVTAFLVNGHLETGTADNPYTETVQRAMRRVFQYVSATAIPSSKTTPLGTYSPDTNGNGIGIVPGGSQGDPFYQSGMFFNAIVATGTPNAVAPTGPANVIGRTYKDIVQDMADYMFYCQYAGATAFGGWRYACNQWPDGSAVQWVAIGLIGAQQRFGITVPQIVKDLNKNWIKYSHDGNGFGYDSPGYYPWGPWAVTPSGMVQNAFVGQGRGHATWDKGETFIRNNFCNAGAANTNMRAYYYGLFSFTKSMLLHDSNADGVPEPLPLLQSATPGVPPIDWYYAQLATGQPCDGVARTLINNQTADGYWYGRNYDSRQYPFETAWAILMLNRSVFEGGNPVAVATATPNPAVAGQTILLSGSSSFHQDPERSIVSWAWDLDNNGTFEKTGVTTTVSFPAVGDYPVKLKVCDDSTPQRCAETTVTVRISTPPLAPTADANGPYNFCPAGKPWFLDGSGSVNPDDGQSEPGKPGDYIKAYDWDLDLDGQFDDASAAQPVVTAFFEGKGPGSYLVQLRVKDNTATSFPSSGMPDLTDTDSAQVTVRAGTDPQCSCISNLAARPKLTKVQLTWTKLAGTHHYNVYRGTTAGGPYLKIASTTSTYSTYLDSGPLTLNTTYYYVVRPATAADLETCQSNQASAKPVAR